MRILIACGGAGGHLFPAIALAKELKTKGHGSFFVINRSQAACDAVSRAGFAYRVLRAPMMPYGLSFKWLDFVIALIRARKMSEQIIAEINPDIAVGFGSYISGPIIHAAASMGIRTLVHEQNVFPGRANRMLFKKADRVCLGFEESTVIKNSRFAYTGNPLGPELIECFKAMTKQQALSALGFSEKKNTLLVMGGSSGASKINKLLSDIANMMNEQEKSRIQIAHITGLKDASDIEQAYRLNNITCWVRGFYDNMGLCYKAADLAVCRAGAGTISELAFFGVPALFIPYPLAGCHQNENARLLARHGACVVLQQSGLSAGLLKKEIFSVLDTKGSLNKMADNIRFFSRPDAAARVAAIVTEVVHAQEN